MQDEENTECEPMIEEFVQAQCLGKLVTTSDAVCDVGLPGLQKNKAYFKAFSSPADSPRTINWWKTVSNRLQKHINSDLPKEEYRIVNENCQIRDTDFEEGRKTINMKKNRYGNILPYEQTRVRLQKLEGKDGSDYINASFVGKSGQYIAAQAPPPSAFPDFWRMIYEHDICIIVMLTKEIENDKRKSHRYWPEDKEEEFGEYKIELTSEEAFEDYCLRELTLSKTAENGLNQKKVWQFHYQAWPDHGVPDEGRTLLDVVHSVEELVDHLCGEQDPGAILVHCSAGIGRTGTFCIIHDALRALHRAHDFGLQPDYDSPQAESMDLDESIPGLDEIDEIIYQNEKNIVVPISLLGTLKLLRDQRYGMVTQMQQYIFCYEAILEEVRRLSGEKPREMQRLKPLP